MLMPGSALGIGPETEGIRCKMFPPATHMVDGGADSRVSVLRVRRIQRSAAVAVGAMPSSFFGPLRRMN